MTNNGIVAHGSETSTTLANSLFIKGVSVPIAIALAATANSDEGDIILQVDVSRKYTYYILLYIYTYAAQQPLKSTVQFIKSFVAPKKGTTTFISTNVCIVRLIRN